MTFGHIMTFGDSLIRLFDYSLIHFIFVDGYPLVILLFVYIMTFGHIMTLGHSFSSLTAISPCGFVDGNSCYHLHPYST
jgi:hypothetical protein